MPMRILCTDAKMEVNAEVKLSLHVWQIFYVFLSLVNKRWTECRYESYTQM
jgi:hypothetical protein